MIKVRPLAERFWEKVDKRGLDECWLWLAGIKDSGHGIIQVENRPLYVHRVSYELANGPVPVGLIVRHRCDRANCVNPRHLILGTKQDNNDDRMERSSYRKLNRPKPVAVMRFKGGPKPQPIMDRLLASIEKTPDGCWEWRGTRIPHGKIARGRGVIKLNGRMCHAHRVMYETFVGPIPDKIFVLHTCDNGACVNPDHLRLGSHAENMADMKQRGRAAKGKDNHFGQVAYQGSKNGMAKLTEDAVREIRAGMTIKQAMDRFGISVGTASKVINGSLWKHVI